MGCLKNNWFGASFVFDGSCSWRDAPPCSSSLVPLGYSGGKFSSMEMNNFWYEIQANEYCIISTYIYDLGELIECTTVVLVN